MTHWIDVQSWTSICSCPISMFLLWCQARKTASWTKEKVLCSQWNYSSIESALVCLLIYLFGVRVLPVLKISPFKYLSALLSSLELNGRGGVKMCASGWSQAHTSSSERLHQWTAGHGERDHQGSSLGKQKSVHFSEARALSIWFGMNETILDI